jgi:hypothetical protein
MPYHYRDDVLERLRKHGICPKSTTRPEAVRELVNDLYRFELRRLRERLLRREFPTREYSGKVIELRKQYLLLSIPVAEWTI